MKILVVEDSRSSLATLTKYVEHFGATAIPAENGEMALDLFSHNRPDLVLLNIALPDTDGFAVAQRIRAMEKPGDWTPIIFLASLGLDADIEQGIAAGGDDYLPKPVSEIVLGAKIRTMQRIVLMRASLLAVTRKLDAANQELIRISSSDGLTGVANRRYFDEAISVEWRRARRHSNSIAVLMCDIDHFKLFNDAYGHQAGDECLRKVAAAISRHTERPSDTVARFGGEEFAVILPETSIAGALMVAEKIRHAIRELNIVHATSPTGQVALSIGIASAAPGFDNPPDDLILAADKALYRAKQEGRDRVCRADAT
ncbi:GGDEF domain-containing response regulator [Ferribacterium limneticum]|uniref:GGDEF domain-containing response regulator n=1 Tax=Ferribacterium limneticum TaxID=76259 RepID=UPI001CFBE5D7|nr:diguanylate cyclase [Ferribacterium limneticum]UCV27112.1 diguanylate cyclase [Ferribacterium limneticum]UCV31029.1 diguanylate cyclase [Ferribacterium limneticum]